MIETNDVDKMGREERLKTAILFSRSQLKKEKDLIANLSNISAILNVYMEDINWAGFYLMKDGELVLGPFQGKPACIRIGVGEGVCGTAVMQRRSQMVSDVHALENHIACDSASRSELVVPIFKGETVFGVLDLDSPSLARFTDLEKSYMEDLVRLIEDSIRE
ncbi:MAG TPA: GAF domain-containing protein [Clostridiaceae bacterium]|nr:GAF domain-containing protein [Clostridiaceae bacterium]